MTVLAHVKRQLLATLVVCALAAAIAATGLLSPDQQLHFVPPANAAGEAPSPSQQLLDAHHCWTHEAPARMKNKLPGHVVVTTRSGHTVYGGPRLVGLALDQQFAHKSAGLTIRGFCR